MRELKIFQRITPRVDSLESYLLEISKEKILSSEEELQLIINARKGDKKSEEKLIKSNLRFVVSVAKQYQNLGLSLNDLIQAGNIGLLTALQRFDETRGFKFISYAVWWIRQSILYSINMESYIVRIPQTA